MMKKIISAVLILSFSALLLASCGVAGVSVPYYTLALDNYADNIFDDYKAALETVKYYRNGEEVYTYSVYMERSLESEYVYNVCENFTNYTFYGHEGEIYSVTDGKTYAIIQADKSNYYEYVKPYEERAHVLDQGDKYQIYSKELEGDITEVSYYAKMTPSIAADLYEYGISQTDKIISTYTLDENNYYLTVEYSVEHSDGTQEKIATRTFEYFKEKEKDVFETIPDLSETVNVTIVSYVGTLNETCDVYAVPRGVYIGLDPGAKNLSFYTDEACNVEFDFETALANGDMTIYAKNN